MASEARGLPTDLPIWKLVGNHPTILSLCYCTHALVDAFSCSVMVTPHVFGTPTHRRFEVACDPNVALSHARVLEQQNPLDRKLLSYSIKVAQGIQYRIELQGVHYGSNRSNRRASRMSISMQAISEWRKQLKRSGATSS